MLNKEKYLSSETFDKDISLIYNELEGDIRKTQRWDATIERSVLIITDMQNYFLSLDSHALIPSARDIIPNIRKLADLFRENNRPVIFTKHVNTKENAASMVYWWKDLIRNGDPSSEIIEDLILPGDTIVSKNQYDAFHETGLEAFLKEKNVLYPVICGVMANLCCETTTRSAFVRGFRPVMPVDATAAYNREFHLATFRNLGFGFSPLMMTREVMDKLRP